MNRKAVALRHPTIKATKVFSSRGRLFTLVSEAVRLPYRLPRNYSSIQALDDAGFDGKAFHSIATKVMPDIVLGNLGPCSLVEYLDPVYGGKYAFFDCYRRRILLSGAQHEPQHLAILADFRSDQKREGAWFLDRWFGNYYHWTSFCLPKLLMLIEAGMSSLIVLPRGMPDLDFIASSMELLGCKLERIERLSSPVTTFRSLTAVEGAGCSPYALKRLRAKLLEAIPAVNEQADASRGVYISRKNAFKRRLVNEDEIIDFLIHCNVRDVHAESLSFVDQLLLFSKTRVLIGLHGAGLANMIWMPPGSHIIEIIGEKTTYLHFYELALVLGHHYWLVNSTAVPPAGGSSQDVASFIPDFKVDLSEFSAAVEEALICASPG